jgi:hypothetical protein
MLQRWGHGIFSSLHESTDTSGLDGITRVCTHPLFDLITHSQITIVIGLVGGE